MYVVIDKDGRTQYAGNDAEAAIRTLEAFPGAAMEKPETDDDFAALMKRVIVTPPSASRQEPDSEDESAEKITNEIVDTVKKRFTDFTETVWTNLGQIGVTKETLAEAWNEARKEVNQKTTEAENNGKKVVGAVADLLVKAGQSLNRHANQKGGKGS
jgi:hypothetical protein